MQHNKHYIHINAIIRTNKNNKQNKDDNNNIPPVSQKALGNSFIAFRFNMKRYQT